MATPGQVMPPTTEEEGQAVPFTTDALAALNRSDIEMQVEFARKNPRSIEKMRNEMKTITALSQEVALSMFYHLPRGGGIVGPGVRFAECLVMAWGNARSGVRILGEDGNVAKAQGLFFDCEKNVGIAVESQRSIIDKYGKKYNADMIAVTGNAAASVGYRNAIFRGIPRALWNDIYEHAKLVGAGESKSFAKQVNEAVEQFSKQGVTEVMILNALRVPSVRDLTADHIVAMRAMFAQIHRGENTIEELFGSAETEQIDRYMDELGWNTSKQRLSREAFKGRPTEHLAYLREQMIAAGKITTTPEPEKKPTPAPAETKAKPAAQQQAKPATQEKPAETPKEEDTTTAASAPATPAPSTSTTTSTNGPNEDAWMEGAL